MNIILLKQGKYRLIELTHGQETYICTGFQYHYWNGLLIPYLIIKCDDSISYFPFIGTKYLYLSSKLYCTSCLQPIEKMTWIGWCPDCENQEKNKKFSCIFTKAGQPFGIPCNPSRYSSCNDESFRNHFCGSEYVLYLGRFGARLKCGIARKAQSGHPQGYRFRIMNQGFDEAHVFQGLTPLHLAWAQVLEEDITRYLNISQTLTFQDKHQEIIHSGFFNNLDSFNELISLLEDAFPELKHLESLCLASDYWTHSEVDIFLQTHSSHIPIARYLTAITGNVVFARGELILLNNGGKFYWLNLRDLQGHSYIHHEV